MMKKVENALAKKLLSRIPEFSKKDDSSEFVDGLMQATASQLCSLPSIRYAKDIVGFHLDNPAHMLTQVMILVFLK